MPMDSSESDESSSEDELELELVDSDDNASAQDAGVKHNGGADVATFPNKRGTSPDASKVACSDNGDSSNALSKLIAAAEDNSDESNRDEEDSDDEVDEGLDALIAEAECSSSDESEDSPARTSTSTDQRILQQKTPTLKRDTEGDLPAVAVSATPDSAPAALPDFVERRSTLRIADAAFTESFLAVQMKGRTYLQIQDVPRVQVKDFDRDDKNWVLIAVLSKKSEVRLTKGGKKYSIWTLTDLREVTISVFLFDAAHASRWKEPVGSVIAVLSPKVQCSTTEAKGRLLSVSQPNQLIRIGRAADLSFCKQDVRRNGRDGGSVRCNVPIHASKMMCTKHLAMKIKRARSNRGMLNSVAQARANDLLDAQSQIRRNMSQGNYHIGRNLPQRSKTDNFYSKDGSARSNRPLTKKDKRKYLEMQQRRERLQQQKPKRRIGSERGNVRTVAPRRAPNAASFDPKRVASRGNGARMVSQVQRLRSATGSHIRKGGSELPKYDSVPASRLPGYQGRNSAAVFQRNEMRRSMKRSKTTEKKKRKKTRLRADPVDELAAAIEGRQTGQGPTPVKSSDSARSWAETDAESEQMESFRHLHAPDTTPVSRSSQTSRQLSVERTVRRQMESKRKLNPQHAALVEHLKKNNMTDIEANKWEPQRKNASTKQLSKVEVERSKSQAASLERRSKLSAAFGGKIKDVHHRDKVLSSKSKFSTKDNETQEILAVMVAEEQLHERQRATESIERKMFLCRQCKVYHRRRTNDCANHGHRLEYKTVTIYFSKCRRCKRRQESYNTPTPSVCQDCGGRLFVPCGMRDAAKEVSRIQAYDSRTKWIGNSAAGF